MNTLLKCTALAGLLLVATADCKTTPAQPDAFLLRGEGRAIPPLQPVSMVETSPPIEEDGTEDQTRAFRVGDLRVIHKKTEANSVVQVQLYVLGGCANLTPQTAGIERLALEVAVSGGTEQTPKDEYNAQLDATGAAIYSFTDRDYSGYGLKTLNTHFDQNWELFTQAVLTPAMPDKEVELRREQQLAGIAAMLDSPDRQLTYESGQFMFAEHPYSRLHIGTKENVESFTRDELLAYQRAMLVPANMLVVVVGDVPQDDLLDRISSTFGRIAPKRAAQIEAPQFTSQPGLRPHERELPTNYVLGMFDAPKPGDDDYAAMLVAVDYLRERLFEEVRTKRNLTYAVSSGLADQRANYGYLYVTAADPEATLPVIFAEVEKLRTKKIDAEQLEQTVNVFITDHYMGLQTHGSQASALAQAELTGGDWRLADGLLTDIRAVTPRDVRRAAEKYLHGYRFTVVGPTADLPPSLFGFEAADPGADAAVE